MIKNLIGKGENAAKQHFLFFQQCFQKTTFCHSLEVGIMVKGLKPTKSRGYIALLTCKKLTECKKFLGRSAYAI